MLYALLLLVVQSPTPITYETAVAISKRDNVPLVVVIGSESCLPCKKLWSEVNGIKRDEMGGAVAVYVDASKRPDLARSIMLGSTTPQTVVFGEREGKWTRVRAIGLQSKDRVVEMVKRVLP